MIYWPTKTPARALNLGMNWAPTLARLGDRTIAASAWIVISGDVVLTLPTIAADDKSTATRVSGGTDGTDSIVKNTITLDDGETLDEKAYIKVRA